MNVMWTEMSDPAIIEELSKRFRELRLKKNMQQKELSEYSGVAIGTIRRFENGETISTESLIKVMRGLGILENLEQLIPEEPISPILMKKLQSKKRMRASSSKK
jgi:transcriptional regulator with XRE-family HTH domain